MIFFYYYFKKVLYNVFLLSIILSGLCLCCVFIPMSCFHVYPFILIFSMSYYTVSLVNDYVNLSIIKFSC